mmetsp:Transcript_12393/g.21963  ORF Transcript_12393/g.21963 Transcript_12393/m.21963 type:complete len:143 (+) Transcript_12393:46-474(+)|eukprot:CAMPEP_0205921856 /NCGR_PEP_ID=MMETSP1325-20131115/13520_1 /ASSEMBLY_ACC=CAM_ASM_000708 /TAXON_ID=236786 /ORGANISM="Florenciella sp., Strain RCC1007" /LENGTH=142 /DNA_ID=CAMNT_0053289769 /DNA_START=46 /DNA_END=474 /DNA_ORIENTATION=-
MFARVALLLAMLAGASAFNPTVPSKSASTWTGRAEFLKVAGAVALAPTAAFADEAADKKKAEEDAKAKAKEEADAKAKAEADAKEAARKSAEDAATAARKVVQDQGDKFKSMKKEDYIAGSAARRQALMKQYNLSGDIAKKL